MAILIFMLATGLATAITAWAGIHLLQKEYARYRATFQHETVHGLADFFLFLDPGQLWGVNLLLAMLWAVLPLLLGMPLVVALGAGAAALVLPPRLLAWARQRRYRRVDEQLPDFLLALAGALRAGSGLQSGLRMVSGHAQRPLAQELGLLMQQQRMGLAFNDALDAFHRRVATESVGLVVAAIKVAGHTGGSLAETLERISLTLRTRLQLLGKIRALTSQGRMQARVMACLPIALGLALYALDPHAMSQLWGTAIGWGVLVLVAVLEGVGMYLVRRMVSIEV
ncbi:type II secretion system F family protein [Achromobacter sp. F4_2707]|uniref:type II secretion system F family protein n=1 Tax=Achromobacter sp. F4_2707 TaxID=3114286 RepID=UPI0039C61BA8